MSRTILALSTVALLCASSQIAFADESGAVVGGVGGAAIGNSMTNHRHYHRGYAYHPYHHHYDQY
jgi:hypothetical protein